MEQNIGTITPEQTQWSIFPLSPAEANTDVGTGDWRWIHGACEAPGLVVQYFALDPGKNSPAPYECAICYPREEGLAGAVVKQHMSKSEDSPFLFSLYFSLINKTEHPLLKIKSLTSQINSVLFQKYCSYLNLCLFSQKQLHRIIFLTLPCFSGLQSLSSPIQHQIHVGPFNFFIDKFSPSKLYKLLFFSTFFLSCFGHYSYSPATTLFGSILNRGYILSSHKANK